MRNIARAQITQGVRGVLTLETHGICTVSLRDITNPNFSTELISALSAIPRRRRSRVHAPQAWLCALQLLL